MERPKRKRSTKGPVRAARAGPLAELKKSARVAQEGVVLAAAARLLASRGPAGFNVRDLAESVGASTMVIYTLFGGRDGVLQALSRVGLKQMGDELDKVVTTDGLDYLEQLAWAYRGFATANPEYYYALSASAGLTLEMTSMIRDSRAYALLDDAVARCIKNGTFVNKPRHTITDALWGLIHGMVSLELAAFFPSKKVADERFIVAGTAMLRGFRSNEG